MYSKISVYVSFNYIMSSFDFSFIIIEYEYNMIIICKNDNFIIHKFVLLSTERSLMQNFHRRWTLMKISQI